MTEQPTPTKDTISRHLHQMHGYNMANWSQATVGKLMDQHEQIHRLLAPDRCNHVHHDPPFDPHQFAAQAAGLVITHSVHGGWWEDDDGLHCAGDGALVIPSGDYLGHGGAWPLAWDADVEP